MTTPTPASLAELRAKIDAIDADILQALAQRMGVVAEIAQFKRAHRIAIRDRQREAEVFTQRRQRAEQLGLPTDEIDALYHLILLTSRDQQAALRVEIPPDLKPRTVAVIGASGGIGSFMVRLFADLGNSVLAADLDTELTPVQAAQRADVILISVPIPVTEQVIRQVGPHVSKDALLMDVTSVKQGPVQAMLEATPASVLGTHPMFGPNVHSLQGQRVVLCPGRGDDWADWVRKMFHARGLVITETTPQAHDRAMAVVQVLNHFQSEVFGLALARFGVPLSDTLQFTSPAYLMELYIAARHFAQAPQLYGPIEMMNPLKNQATAAFVQAARELADIIERADQERFDAVFAEVRDFLGPFSTEAQEKSSFLIDRLVERS